MEGRIEERYTVHFGDREYNDPHFDPLYRATEILRAYLDLEEMGLDAAPLGQVMDTLGYKGDRDRLKDTSCVSDIVINGNDLKFVVRDNYCPFDICTELSRALHMDFPYDVEYVYLEGENLTHSICRLQDISRNPNGLINRIGDAISETLDIFNVRGESLEFGMFAPSIRGMLIDTIGPERDDITLKSDDGSDVIVKLKVGDIDDVKQLEILLEHLENNLSVIKSAENFKEVAPHINEPIVLTGNWKSKCRDIPENFQKQINLIGRCQDPVKMGDIWGLVQKHGKDFVFQDCDSVEKRLSGLISLKPLDESSPDGLQSCILKAGGEQYLGAGDFGPDLNEVVEKFKYGSGLWAKRDSDDKLVFVAYSIEKQGLIETNSYEQARKKAIRQRYDIFTQAERNSIKKSKGPKKH